MSINLGGLSDINQQISEAEKLYFNLAPFIKTAVTKKTPPTNDGGNYNRDVQSLSRGEERGAKIYQEGRINALRQQRAGLNAGSPANVPFEAFDPKNLSSGSNVTESPEHIFATIGEGAPSSQYFADTSQDPTGGLTARWYFDGTKMVYGLIDANGVDVLHSTGNRGTSGAITSQQTAALDKMMKDDVTAYQGAPEFIRSNYTNAAKNAGTYSDTAEFQKGLNDEIALGVAGVDEIALARMNALRQARGLQPISSMVFADQPTTTNPQSPINFPSPTPPQTGATDPLINNWLTPNTGPVATAPPNYNTQYPTGQKPSPFTLDNYEVLPPPSFDMSATAPATINTQQQVASDTKATSNTSSPTLQSTQPAVTASSDTGTAAAKEGESEYKGVGGEGSPEAQLSDSNLTSGVKMNNKSRMKALQAR